MSQKDKDTVLTILKRPSQVARMVFGSDGSAACYCREDKVAHHNTDTMAVYLTFAEVSARIYPMEGDELQAVLGLLRDKGISNNTVPTGINVAEYRGQQVLMICDEYVDLLEGRTPDPKHRFPGFSVSPAD